ncbi:MAG: nucleoside hydrolase [Bacteroidaceae bacterium]|nr:nucleoside hydrolase [Bacteroidaceae bacterium]
MNVEKSTKDNLAKTSSPATGPWREYSRRIFQGVSTMIAKRPWALAAIMALCGMIMLPSCSDDNSSAKEGEEPYTGIPLVIYDTDIGSSTDDLFALEMLYRYEEEGRCKLLGVVVDREGEDCAAVADVMNTYFGHANVPIGLVRKGISNPPVWIDYKALPTYTTDDEQPMFHRTVRDYSTLPEGFILYRQLLAAQPDHSVSICSVGFVTALADLLTSEGDDISPLSGVELVKHKVKCLYIMGGVFGESVEPDFNFAQGITFAQTFFSLWPEEVDVVFSPMEVGQEVEYKPEQVVSDIPWTDIHPIKQVYMTCNCNTGQKMWDPMVIIHAVEGDASFYLSERGTVTLTPEAQTIFTPSATGNCRYQLPGNEMWNALMLEKIRNYNKMKH